MNLLDSLQNCRIGTCSYRYALNGYSCAYCASGLLSLLHNDTTIKLSLEYIGLIRSPLNFC
jgi:hypothetical protein